MKRVKRVKRVKPAKRPDPNHCLICGRDVRHVKERTQDGHQHAKVKCWVSDCETNFTVCGACGGIVRAQAMRSFHELTLHGRSADLPSQDAIAEVVRTVACTGAYDLAEALASRFKVDVCAVCGSPSGDIVKTSFEGICVRTCEACRRVSKK
jgi:hypothetical protein